MVSSIICVYTYIHMYMYHLFKILFGKNVKWEGLETERYTKKQNQEFICICM